jgi:uncharacterized protein
LKSVGRIAEIWRYPVSSVGGEGISWADLSASGVGGDRQYGLIDTVSGLPAAPENDRRWRKALFLEAKCVSGELPTLFFPSGRSYPINDRSLGGVLCDYFGFAVSIAAYDHTVLQLGLPLTQFRHRHFPMHLLTTASLDHLATSQQVAAVDFRRFRPTVLIETRESEGFLEDGWMSKRLRLGAIDLTVREETKRCGMTFISQPGLDEDPEILRNILRHNKRHLGIYCSIENTGTIHVGDELFI